MAPYVYDQLGRRVAAPSKGQLRERAILDAAEKQLRADGPDAMTVESIANAAGIGRAALYFYFRSKNDVLAALVDRAVAEMTTGVATSEIVHASSGAAAIGEAVRRTALLWRTHGAVLRAAVDLSPGVAVIDTIWSGARTRIEDSALEIVARDIARDPQLRDRAPSVVRALVAMTERELYTASASETALDDAVDTLTLIWTRTLQLS